MINWAKTYKKRMDVYTELIPKVMDNRKEFADAELTIAELIRLKEQAVEALELQLQYEAMKESEAENESI